ncbi:hypothetical protein NHH73_06695 [Oxalobacteraceae bacterium OTU3CINTB1]|nr:hypothetical protein NHH73_06695 [Oxalobacteraceae bacterium OTU3CINTB1]
MPLNPTSLRRAGARLLALTAAGALSACANAPNIDRQFGASVRTAVAQQTLDPGAANDRRPVNGLDAKAAAAAYENYQRSFTTQDLQQSGPTIGSGIR